MALLKLAGAEPEGKLARVALIYGGNAAGAELPPPPPHPFRERTEKLMRNAKLITGNFCICTTSFFYCFLAETLLKLPPRGIAGQICRNMLWKQTYLIIF
jgi:hypothetical protein